MNGKKLISKNELKEYLGCSLGTIDNLMRNGSIEYIKVGNLVRFDLEDIENNLSVMKIRGINVIKRKDGRFNK